ncbi:MAG: hypothetical protein P4L96_16870 [Rhodoferax sp.]|nr:hypothetical protein [Rhodoferax sp.]
MNASSCFIDKKEATAKRGLFHAHGLAEWKIFVAPARPARGQSFRDVGLLNPFVYEKRP